MFINVMCLYVQNKCMYHHMINGRYDYMYVPSMVIMICYDITCILY